MIAFSEQHGGARPHQRLDIDLGRRRRVWHVQLCGAAKAERQALAPSQCLVKRRAR